MTLFTPNRRDMLKTGGILLGLALPMGRAAAQGTAAAGEARPFAPNAFVRVTPDNLVRIVIKHIEFGQGPATGLATLVADEMDADWSQVRIEMAPANDELYKNLFFGTMGTGGSSAIANSWIQHRTAGAAARAMLVAAAAKRWGVAADAVTVSRGVVASGTRSATFGELAEDAAGLTPPEKPVLKTPDRWTLIGRDVPKVDSAAKTDGSAVFTMDIRRPGMLHSAILHPPAFGATVKQATIAGALAVPGVQAVRTIAQGVVVYATDSYAAMKGRAALDVEWDFAKAEQRSSETLFKLCAEAAAKPDKQAAQEGDVDAALASAARTLEATYYFPYLAHAPMEPLDAVLELGDDDGVDVWMGSQFQVGEIAAMAGVLGKPMEKMRLHQQYAGGSFGRRATPGMEFAVEAAAAFKAMGGSAPLKHVWMRENDLRGGWYRPLTVHRLRGGIDAAGNITAWDQGIAAQSIFQGTAFEAMGMKGGIDNSMVEGATEGSYRFPNHRVGASIVRAGVPVLWWRSVGHTHTAYAVETFVDELLALAGKDAVEGRLALMGDERARKVLVRAAEMARWGRALPEGRALGVAVHKSFRSYVAQVAEVSRGEGHVPRVHRIWCAVDCGVPVNPNVIRAQMEGGIGYGIGHALYAELVLGEGGIVAQGNFDSYRSLRIGEMPAIEVSVMASQADPTGVGEPGVPPSAPAVANAWRRLTGKAVRRLPFAHGDNA